MTSNESFRFTEVGAIAGRDMLLRGEYVAGRDINLTGNIGFPPSDYRAEIAPLLAFYQAIFVGRAAEWTELIRFSNKPEPGYLVITAPPGYGKSALVAETVRRLGQHRLGGGEPIPDLIFFFIREGGYRNQPADLLTAVNSQLIGLLNIQETVPTDLGSLSSQFIRLWAEGVTRASEHRPLLLMVDGLDEASTEGPDLVTFLPAHLGQYVHVAVTSRANPDPFNRVSPEHPLRRASAWKLGPLNTDDVQLLLVEQGAARATRAVAERVRSLTGGEPLLARFTAEDVARRGEEILNIVESARPQGAREYFAWQLRQLDARLADSAQPATSRAARDVLGLLLSTHGPISQAELSEALQVPLFEIRKAVALIERFLLGNEQLELMHQDLRRLLSDYYFSANEMTSYTAVLRDWCLRLEAAGWPATTPEYVVNHSASHLAEAGDAKALSRLIDHPWMRLRHQRMRSYLGFAKDVTLAIRIITKSAPPDIPEELRCSLVRCTVGSSAQTPSNLLAALVQLGGTERAREQILLQQNAVSQANSYCEVAAILVEKGYSEEAASFLELGRQELDEVSDARAKSGALTRIAYVLHAHMPEEAAQFAQRALDAARQVQDAKQRVEILRLITADHFADKFPSISASAAKIVISASTTFSGPEGEDDLIVQAGRTAARFGDQIGSQAAASHLAQLANDAQGAYEKEGRLSKAASIYFDHGDLEKGLEFLSLLAALPEQSWQTSYARAHGVRALAQAGRFDTAAALADIISEYTAKAIAIRNLALELGRAGFHDRALDLMQTVADGTMQTEGLNLLSRILFKGGRTNIGLNVAALALDMAIQLEGAGRALSLRALVDTLTGVGDVGVSLAVDRLTSIEPRDSELASSLTRALVKKGCLAEALSVARNIPEPSERQSSIGTVIRANIGSGNVLDAIPLLSEAPSPFRADWIGAVALKLIECGYSDKARPLVEEGLAYTYVQHDWNYRAEAFAGIAQALSIHKDRALAARAARHALVCARVVNMNRARAGAFAAAAAALWVSGVADEATEAAGEALRMVADMERDPQGAVLTAGEVAAAMAGTGIPQARDAALAALKIALKMASDDVGKSNAIAHAAAALGRCGEGELALRTAQEPSIGKDRIRALAMTATAIEESGNPQHAMAAASAALAIADVNVDAKDYAESLSDIAELLARHGQEQRGYAIMRAALSGAQLQRGHQNVHIVRSAATVVAATSGSPSSVAKKTAAQALSVAADIKDEHERARALGWAAVALDRSGESVAAMRAAVESVQELRKNRGTFGKVWSFIEVGSAMSRAPALGISDVLWEQFQAMLEADTDVDVDLHTSGTDSHDVCTLALRGAFAVASRGDRVSFFFMIRQALELGVSFGSGATLAVIADKLVTTDEWLLS